MSEHAYLGKLLIGGKWVNGATSETLRDKFTQAPYGVMGIASPEQVDQAVAGAVEAFSLHRLDPVQRHAVLSKASQLVQGWRDRIVDLMTSETGFTQLDGENEVNRCAQTLLLAAEEAKRLTGEMVPMDATPGLKRRLGFTILVPKGVVCAITPYNSPLNTVAHKIAPAIAAGNAVILKPSEFTPLTASILCQALIEAGLPAGLISLLHGAGADVGRRLLADQRIAYYTFTGSTRVGKEIQAAAGLRGTQLELGSIASTILCADADIGLAIAKFNNACFRKAGQVCTSVQRIFVHRSIYDEFVARFIPNVRSLAVGDPRKPDTVVGPMISLAQAERAESWIRAAVAGGAEVMTGGTREGAVLQPTVMQKVKPDMQVVCQEIFAPVVSLVSFDNLADAVRQANATPYGLAVGVFTRDIRTALEVSQQLDFGAVHINETSSSRVDVMPFGGVKDSGFGREGPRYAVREMLEERLVTVAY